MKINKVILSSTNDEFLDFYPIVSEAWRNIGIEPILFLINGNENFNKEIVNIDFKSFGKDEVFLSQIIRILAPCLYPDDTLILSDIDMMPLSKNYFTKHVENYSDDLFINLRSGVTKPNMYPICYSIAKGSTWREIFKVNNLEGIELLISNWFQSDYKKHENKWYLDQIKLFEFVSSFSKENPKRFVELYDIDTNFCRLNRTNLKFRFSKFYDLNKVYTDFHMPRPYKKYKKIIKKVFEINFGKSFNDV